MCYNVSFEVYLQNILDAFPGTLVDAELQDYFPTAPYVNGFDHKMHPVMVTGRKDGQRHLASMMWGFVPNWVKNMEEAARMWNGYKDESGKYRPGIITLNAIGEEMLDKPMYKDAAANRRCIVFADAFYEWHHHFPIGKRGARLKTAVKYPHLVSIRNNPYPFMMIAGIWSPWRHTEVDTSTGEVKEMTTPTFSIVTTAANELMAKIHNSKKRMPCILTKSLAEEWISEALPAQRIKEIAAHQYPASEMEAYTIAKDFQELSNPKERFEYVDWDGEMC
jgi:putative SOS response-associated peptidase YedK